MMRKTLLSLLLLFIVISITGCGLKKETKEKPTVSNNNSVVLYFSATGTTKSVAKRIASLSGSDLLEIVPKEKYKSEDLDYNNDCRANREQNDSMSRPEIENEIDIEKYDTVYLGYPIWWGTNPKIILTLFDKYDFTGKTIIPFCTSGSSSIDKSVSDLKNYNKDINIEEGKRFSSSSSDEDILAIVKNVKKKEVINKMNVIINEKEYEVNLESNETVNSFIDTLPKEFNMNDLNNNEKYVYLDEKLPAESLNVKHINAGDVMLFGDDCLVIFYKSFDTTYSYTKIGHIDNLPDLGSGSVTVRFEK